MLTPVEIRNKEFSKGAFGYKKNEVDEFLSIDVSTNVYYPKRFPRLLYICGHSYEFDNNDNWDHLEEICKAISGKDDIWYATNMEIYEYKCAYDSLIFSYDGTMVKNPSSTDVYAAIMGKEILIPGGQTVKLG